MSLEAGDHGTSAADGQFPGGPGLTAVAGVPPPHFAHAGELPLEGALAVYTGVMFARVCRVERGWGGARPGSCCQESWKGWPGWGFTGESPSGMPLAGARSLSYYACIARHPCEWYLVAYVNVCVWNGMPMGCACRLSGKLFVGANWTVHGTVCTVHVCCMLPAYPCS